MHPTGGLAGKIKIDHENVSHGQKVRKASV